MMAGALPFNVIEVPDSSEKGNATRWIFEVFEDANDDDSACGESLPPACFVSDAAMRDVLREKMGGPLPADAEAYFHDRLKKQEALLQPETQTERRRGRTQSRRRTTINPTTAIDSAMLMVLRKFPEFTMEKRFEILRRYFEHLQRRTASTARRPMYHAWMQLIEKCKYLRDQSDKNALQNLFSAEAFDFYGLKCGKAAAFLAQSAGNVRPLTSCGAQCPPGNEANKREEGGPLTSRPRLSAVLAERNLATLAELVLSRALVMQEKGGITVLCDPMNSSSRNLQMKVLAQTLAVLPPKWLCRDPIAWQRRFVGDLRQST